MATLAVFSVKPYEFRILMPPDTRSNSRLTEIGNAVEPVTKLRFREDRSSPCGGVFANTEKVVGTPDRRVTRNRAINFQ
jgi:hypothetical protein